MRRVLLFLFLAACCACSGLHGNRELINDGWQFRLAPDTVFTDVHLPHDWGVQGDFLEENPCETGKLTYWGHGGYRRILSVSDKELQGRICLDFGGVMSNASVYVGDSLVCRQAYGYSSFRADLTPFLHPGDNLIRVLVDNPDDSSRWYPGGGIYRNVHLVTCPDKCLKYNGVSITQELDQNLRKATIRAEAELLGAGPATVRFALYSPSGRRLGSSKTDSDTKADAAFEVASPLLWSPETPALYKLVVSVLSDGGRQTESFELGIRSSEFKSEGYYLNGHKYRLQGVCLHHDAGPLGAVWNTGIWEERLRLLKEMGCNAIRTSHNPPAPEFLDLCDRMGFLVVDEFTDSWLYGKKPHGYAEFFPECYAEDIASFIRRDRNHPSVIMWSIANEVYEQRFPKTWYIGDSLAAICHREDSSRPCTSGNEYLPASDERWRDIVDVYGHNYKPEHYASFHQKYPEKPFYASETASCVSTRGFYKFPLEEDKAGGREGYCISSYDLYAPSWAVCPDYEWRHEDAEPALGGEFVWTGYDYIGEPTPFNDYGSLYYGEGAPYAVRSSYFGIIDLAGFPKDRYYLYQSRWNPDLPMVHIVPHWTWPGREGEVTPVHVYTSGDSAELFVNDVSMGLKSRGAGEYRLRWDDIRYASGTLRVQAYKDGAPWADEELHTAGPVASLRMEPSPKSRLANAVSPGEDEMRTIRVYALDSEGNHVPDASFPVTFSVSGPAVIVATEAGDPTDMVPFRSHTRNLFHGCAMAVVRRTGPGEVVVSACGSDDSFFVSLRL